MNVIRDNIGNPQTVSLDTSSIEALRNVANTPNTLGSSESKTSLSAGGSASNLEALEKLADLRDRGILTEKEFEDEKAKDIKYA